MAKVSTPRMRPVLSRDVIAEVALRLTLEQAATPLTLARLGAELGADPTALYRHYRSRDELLRDLADRVFVTPNASFQHQDDWRKSLTQFAMSLCTEVLRRPALVAEVGARFTGGPNERRSVEIHRAILRRAGFAEDMVTSQTRALGSLFVSHAVMTAILMALPQSALDIDVAIAREINGDDIGDSYEFENHSFEIILGTYLDGLATQLGQQMAAST
ncbi:MAG: TetR family transcriptional regulator [Ilumatobacteraceae bacterium]|nr:TetR family transcriptional regulator [Ilumatobacteraceae bacterium]